MSQVLFSLALLACPVGMGLMMWFMMRGKKSGDEQQAPLLGSSANDAELAKLRAEMDQLRASQRDAEQGPWSVPAKGPESR